MKLPYCLFEYFYYKTTKYDLVNKFFYKNTKKIPKFQKIVLNFNCKTTDIKQISTTLLALELITGKRRRFVTKDVEHFLLRSQ